MAVAPVRRRGQALRKQTSCQQQVLSSVASLAQLNRKGRIGLTKTSRVTAKSCTGVFDIPPLAIEGNWNSIVGPQSARNATNAGRETWLF